MERRKGHLPSAVIMAASGSKLDAIWDDVDRYGLTAHTATVKLRLSQGYGSIVCDGMGGSLRHPTNSKSHSRSTSRINPIGYKEPQVYVKRLIFHLLD